ncbi:MAG TPA: type I phosphomannose isomerase catalytic subunit, partial [Terrimicrobiaceae bacterium]
LPQGVPIGESWEIVDREDAQSVVHNGPLRGATLHELWNSQREEIFGAAYHSHEAKRFPLLIKLRDARERLSVQVHPPPHMAETLGGEAKTEMWYFADAQPGANIYAGLKSGVTREQFEALLREGRVEEAVHVVPVENGDSIFIPSGRLHAIGQGNVIVEVQQNSDTTYRVFDWNRTGLDGMPRKLHIEESMLSIDFDDFEPHVDHVTEGVIAECPYFTVEKLPLASSIPATQEGKFTIFAVVGGGVSLSGTSFKPGDFFLAPASIGNAPVEPTEPNTQVLRTTLPLPA